MVRPRNSNQSYSVTTSRSERVEEDSDNDDRSDNDDNDEQHEYAEAAGATRTVGDVHRGNDHNVENQNKQIQELQRENAELKTTVATHNAVLANGPSDGDLIDQLSDRAVQGLVEGVEKQRRKPHPLNSEVLGAYDPEKELVAEVADGRGPSIFLSFISQTAGKAYNRVYPAGTARSAESLMGALNFALALILAAMYGFILAEGFNWEFGWLLAVLAKQATNNAFLAQVLHESNVLFSVLCTICFIYVMLFD